MAAAGTVFWRSSGVWKPDDQRQDRARFRPSLGVSHRARANARGLAYVT